MLVSNSTWPRFPPQRNACGASLTSHPLREALALEVWAWHHVRRVVVPQSTTVTHPHTPAKGQRLRRIFYKCFLLRSPCGFRVCCSACIIIAKGKKLSEATALIGRAMPCPRRGAPGATKLASGNLMCEDAK